jgi:STE24 endopeptidase
MGQKIYSPHFQKKAKLYHRKKDILSILQTTIVSVYLLLIYLSRISGYISHAVLRFSFPIALLLYLAIFGVPLLLLVMPFSKREYLIEKRFGLSQQGTRGWRADQIKAILLSFVLGYPLLLLLFLLFSRVPRYWWILAAGGFSFFQLFISFLFPVLILPIFFRQRTVEDDELNEGVRKLFSVADITLEGVYSFNLSAKTRRENALVAGFWKTRRVLIGDNVLQNRTITQIIVVIAHEIGHHIKRHMIKLLGVSLIGTALLLFSFNGIMNLWEGFPAKLESTLGLLPIMALFAGLLSVPVMIGMNAYSRLIELEADRVALDLTGDAEPFIAVMAGLAESNLSLLRPNPLKVLLFFSHPPTGKRIELAKRYRISSAT